MINANELRIGNWISVNGSHGTVNAPYLVEIVRKNNLWIKLSDGIPLTTEILEKCGLVNSHALKERFNDGFWTKQGFATEIGYITTDDYYEFEINGIVRPLKYLHQLQNLYFALTGNELEYKP